MTIGGVKSQLWERDGKQKVVVVWESLPPDASNAVSLNRTVRADNKKKGSHIPAEASPVYPILAETINRGYGLGVALLFAF
ncbi:MAG TPA: hypothetical protein VFH01_06755 [Pyrinomonadaceae bacterium]|nr:hypothetical protein [Pyrinomonadaceae bacterium]